MNEINQVEKAQILRDKIISNGVCVLPEVWDVASARVLADSGFEVIGTSAAAIAWANGYQPHERLKLEELLLTAGRISRGWSCPVNADLEGGLDRSVNHVKRGVQAALTIGCAGVTIGDGSRNGAHGVMSTEEMANRIKAARAAALEVNIPAVITARTETFFLGPLGASPFDSSIERAEAYFDAGADCVLIPGVQHLQIVERLAKNIDGPIAISVSLSSAPDLKSLEDAGVACVTLGSSLIRSLLGNLRVKAEEIIAFGRFTHLDRVIPQDELEALLR